MSQTSFFPSLPLTTTISPFWLQWLLGGLLHYQTSYTNIVIIHSPTFISVCSLRQHTFYFMLDM